MDMRIEKKLNLSLTYLKRYDILILDKEGEIRKKKIKKVKKSLDIE